ncbi:MAG: PilL N-terminal domain-containing protein [Parahaliea sp.]
MPSIRLTISAKCLALIAGLIPATIGTGCVPTVPPVPAGPQAEATPPPVPGDWLPVARYGRYTLVELAPQAAQSNLLLQMVDRSLPSTADATVGDGLRQVLQRSGYVLCDGDPQVASLYELPLPAAHLQLGPMFLHDALLTLAGPAWELQVDHRTRQVCFTPNQEASP